VPLGARSVEGSSTSRLDGSFDPLNQRIGVGQPTCASALCRMRAFDWDLIRGPPSVRGCASQRDVLDQLRAALVQAIERLPLCWAPGRADRVTPLFRFVCARRPLLPSHVPAQSPGGMAPDYLSPQPVEWFKCNR
jgi:hypothetical protein